MPRIPTPVLRRARTLLVLLLAAGTLSACCNPFWYGSCGPGGGRGGYGHGAGPHGHPGGGRGGFYGGGGGGRGWR